MEGLPKGGGLHRSNCTPKRTPSVATPPTVTGSDTCGPRAGNEGGRGADGRTDGGWAGGMRGWERKEE